MTTLVHVGELLTGRITDTIPVTAAPWSATLNEWGSIGGVTVEEDVVRDLRLRERSHGMRTFLAVEKDNRIKQAGPITSRGRDWETGQLAFGARGIGAYLDRLIVRPDDPLIEPYAANVFTVSGKSLGGIARALVVQATNKPYTAVPIVLPPDEAGDRTESFPAWQVQWCGEELRQLTQRASDAPDIRFTPRRREDDPRFIEWVMEVGTYLFPALQQGGPDWVFDTSAPKSPVRGITTDEDATEMAQQVTVSGNGTEEGMLFTFDFDFDLIDRGWPLTEAEASHSTVEDINTLYGHAQALLSRVGRPVEVFKVAVSASAAGEVQPGDYCRLITKGDSWLGDMDRTMRIRTVSGDLSDVITLDMFPLEAVL